MMFQQHLPLALVALAFGFAILMIHRQVSMLRDTVAMMSSAPLMIPSAPAVPTPAEEDVDAEDSAPVLKSILKKGNLDD